MKKWEKFSKKELEDIILNSKTYVEALKKIGYSGTSSSQNKYIKEAAQRYNIPLNHFRNGGAIDLIGQKFGRLEVIKRVENKNQGRARFLCRCDCGNLKEVDGAHLRRGDILSCGCYKREQTIKYNKEEKIIDMIGQRFGILEVISRAENIGEQPAYICRCDCGHITNPIMGANLRRENGTRSCGCMNSKGENVISQILTKNNIDFKREVKFDDCLSNNGGQLRFDFGIYKENRLSHLIEFNGRQHYEETNFFRDSLEKRQEKDNIKIEYCKQNNIPLLIIPYTKVNEITIDKLLLKEDF